jgi:tetratricopeptide (TPR) repeat protein
VVVNLLLIAGPLVAILLSLALWQWVVQSLLPSRVREAQRWLETDDRRSMRLLSSVLALDKRNLEALWLTAQMQAKRKQFVLARMLLFDILQHGEFNAHVTERMVRTRLATIYEHLGEHEKAMYQYYLLRERGDLDPEGLHHLVRMQLDKGNVDEAARILDQAGQSGIRDGELLFLEARMLYERREFRKAETRLAQASQAHYRTHELDQLQGKIFFINGRFAQALAQFQLLPDSDFQSREMESMLGQCFFHLEDYDGAVSSLEGLLSRMEPQSSAHSEVAFVLGSAWENKGDVKKAIGYWELVNHHSRYFLAAKEKQRFYGHVVQDPALQQFLSCPFVQFRMVAERLLECLGFTIKQRLYEDERNLEFFCVNQDQYDSFDTHLVIITRHTAATTPEFLNQKLRSLQASRGKYLCLVAPNLTDAIRAFAQSHDIKVHDFHVFAQYGLIRS